MTNELGVVSLILFYVVLFTFLDVYLACVQYLHYNNYFLYYGYDNKYCVRYTYKFLTSCVFPSNNIMCIACLYSLKL